MLVLLLLLLRGFEMPLELWFRLLWTEAATDEVNCSRAEAAVVGDVVEELLPPFLPPFVYEARSRAALQASMDDQPFMLTIWSRYSKTLDRDGSLNYVRREDLLRKLFLNFYDESNLWSWIKTTMSVKKETHKSVDVKSKKSTDGQRKWGKLHFISREQQLRCVSWTAFWAASSSLHGMQSDKQQQLRGNENKGNGEKLEIKILTKRSEIWVRESLLKRVLLRWSLHRDYIKMKKDFYVRLLDVEEERTRKSEGITITIKRQPANEKDILQHKSVYNSHFMFSKTYRIEGT